MCFGATGKIVSIERYNAICDATYIIMIISTELKRAFENMYVYSCPLVEGILKVCRHEHSL